MTRILLFFIVLSQFHLAYSQETTLHRCSARCRNINTDLYPLQTSQHINPERNGNQTSSLSQTCPPNIDFEWGNFTHWQTNVGTVDTIITLSDTQNVITLPSTTWIANANTPPPPQRQVLMDRNLGAIDYYGQFPVNPPGRGGRYSLKLGSDEDALGAPHGLPNKKAESARFIINVPNPANDYSITFSYAVVLENPDGTGTGGGGTPANIHQSFAQPRFRMRMYDANTGELVPCSNFDFVADADLPGFFNSIHSYEHRPDAAVKCKNWTDVFVNLSRYAGRTLYLEFTTADCTYGGHFGYAYVDVVECGLTATGLYNCSNQSGILTGPPGFHYYNWFDNNFSSNVGTGQTITVNNTLPNTNFWCVVTPYNVNGCTNCNCVDTVGVKVFYTTPVANAGIPSMTCRNDSVRIGTAPVGSYSYSWTPASGLSDPLVANPWAAPSANTNYIVTVTDTLSHCTASDTVLVSIYPRPLPSFSINDNTQCLSGNQFQFSSTSSISSGNLTYQWTLGDGTVSSSQSVAHQYAQPGTYTVKLIVISENGCKDSISRNIFVFAAPDATFSLQGNYNCFPAGPISFQTQNTYTGYSYLWSFGDGSPNSISMAPSHNYLSTGTYNASVIVTNPNGCSDTAYATISIHAPPSVLLQTLQTPVICDGDSIKITATVTPGEGSLAAQNWFLNSNPLAVSGVNYVFAHQTGSYVMAVSNSYGCTASDTLDVLVNPLPTGDLNTPLVNHICYGGTNQLTATGGDHYQWYLNGNPIPGAVTSSWNADSSGSYSVDIFNSSGCSIRANHVVVLQVIYPPVANFSFDYTCERIPVTFYNQSATAQTGLVTYQWNLGGISSSTSASPSAVFNTPGSYEIQLVATSVTCPSLRDTIVKSLVISANPGGVRYPPVDVVKYRNYQLNARNLGNVFQWSPSTGLNNPNRRDPIFNFNQDVEYLIALKDNSGCPIVDTQLVRVFGKGDIYVPNAFTPNKSGNANDYMYPILVGMIELRYFRIFDRWGRLMFESTQARPGWNGIFNGKPQPMDTYTWTVEAVDIDGRVITRSGNCVLIR